MKMYLLILPPLLAVLLAVSHAAPRKELEAGSPFPELLLPSLDEGQPVSISDFRGEKLVLHIWASW